jgi:hypothetical protein
MKILKYTDNETGITDRGYWNDPDDNSKIGIGTSGDELTLLELEERQLSIHSRYPMMKEINSYMLLEGTSNPSATTGAHGIAHLFYNTASGELFQCTDATVQANVWVKKSYNQVPGDPHDPRGTISVTVIHPPIRQSTAVVMTEAEVRHLIQYWVTQKNI